MVAGFVDVSQETLLLFVHRSAQLLRKKTGESEDRVERRSKLVAHVREELGLHSCRLAQVAVCRGEIAVEPRAVEHGRSTEARAERLKPDALVMHPGPMNRGVEIASDVADGPYSVILEQVTNGVAVRMAVLYLLAGGHLVES